MIVVSVTCAQSSIMPAGGGVALLYASKELEKLQTADFDQKIGVQIIQNALKVVNVFIIQHLMICIRTCL